MTVHENPKPKNPKPKINPIEEAIGERAKPKTEELKTGYTAETFPQHPSEIADVPSPSEMLSLEELNRQTEERLRDEPEEETPQKAIKRAIESQEKIMTPKSPIPVSKLDPQPAPKTSSQESPPQGVDPITVWVCPDCGRVERNKALWNTPCFQHQAEDIVEKELSEMSFQAPIVNNPAEDIEFTALKKYIQEDGFVLATVAFHIVTLCAEPMTTPSTTTWDFVERAEIPAMVLALLNQPGYLEGIWPSLRVVMGSNKGNSAWCAGIATTIAFFDTIRVIPALEELKNG